MSRLLGRAIVALSALVSVSAAQAGTFDYTSYSVLNNQNVSVSLTQPAPKQSVNEAGGSGEIILYSTEVAGGFLPTFCIDIPDWLLSSGTFNTGGVLTGLFGNQVNALMTNVLPTLNADTNASSALQVAIWQEEYGSALTVTAPTAVTTEAAQYIQNVSHGTWVANSKMQVSVLSANGSNQDQAYLTPIPEPTSLAVLGAGLIGIGLFRKRRTG